MQRAKYTVQDALLDPEPYHADAGPMQVVAAAPTADMQESIRQSAAPGGVAVSQPCSTGSKCSVVLSRLVLEDATYAVYDVYPNTRFNVNVYEMKFHIPSGSKRHTSHEGYQAPWTSRCKNNRLRVSVTEGAKGCDVGKDKAVATEPSGIIMIRAQAKTARTRKSTSVTVFLTMRCLKVEHALAISFFLMEKHVG